MLHRSLRDLLATNLVECYAYSKSSMPVQVFPAVPQIDSAQVKGRRQALTTLAIYQHGAVVTTSSSDQVQIPTLDATVSYNQVGTGAVEVMCDWILAAYVYLLSEALCMPSSNANRRLVGGRPTAWTISRFGEHQATPQLWELCNVNGYAAL